MKEVLEELLELWDEEVLEELLELRDEVESNSK